MKLLSKMQPKYLGPFFAKSANNESISYLTELYSIAKYVPNQRGAQYYGLNQVSFYRYISKPWTLQIPHSPLQEEDIGR